MNECKNRYVNADLCVYMPRYACVLYVLIYICVCLHACLYVCMYVCVSINRFIMCYGQNNNDFRLG